MRLGRFAAITAVALVSEVWTAPKSRTLISGTIITAGTDAPVAGATVVAGAETALTDAAGRFAVSVARGGMKLSVSKPDHLSFEYPFLHARRDTMIVRVEIVTDPPNAESLAGRRFLPDLCITDTPDRLWVTNGCAEPDSAVFKRRILKPNPWSPYFGEHPGYVMLITPRAP